MTLVKSLHSTKEGLDLVHLHRLLEHLETNMSRPGIDPRSPASQGGYSGKELFEQLVNGDSEHSTYEPATPP
jgi:hypothetical protein